MTHLSKYTNVLDMLPIHISNNSVYNYDGIEPGYYFKVMEAGGKVQRFWHQYKFDEVVTRIPDGSRVLDVGCGPGSFIYRLLSQKKNCRAVGADLANGQIEFARENVGSKFSSDSVQFVSLDDGKLPEKLMNKQFDFATCIEVIEHIHPFYALQMLEQMKRAIRPNGRVILTTPNYRSLWPLIEVGLNLMSPVKYHEQHISKFTPNSFAKFVETCGLKIEKFSTIFVAGPFL
ncbi:MAG: class I SAM-dependent methyltransferase, partial [Pseudobdellovibrionaceae bacterium]